MSEPKETAPREQAEFSASNGSALPCPFCGSPVVSIEWEACEPLVKTDTNRRWFAECAQCSCQGPFCQKETQVIPAWNTRAPEGVLFRSAASGMWYEKVAAAGDVDAIACGGIIFQPNTDSGQTSTGSPALCSSEWPTRRL